MRLEQSKYFNIRRHRPKGPLTIGGRARWKCPKIWALCMDKFSKISLNMFGLQQASIQKVKIYSDCASGLKKHQICLDWPIRHKKPPNLFGLANQASKN